MGGAVLRHFRLPSHATASMRHWCLRPRCWSGRRRSSGCTSSLLLRWAYRRVVSWCRRMLSRSILRVSLAAPRGHQGLFQPRPLMDNATPVSHRDCLLEASEICCCPQHPLLGIFSVPASRMRCLAGAGVCARGARPAAAGALSAARPKPERRPSTRSQGAARVHCCVGVLVALHGCAGTLCALHAPNRYMCVWSCMSCCVPAALGLCCALCSPAVGDRPSRLLFFHWYSKALQCWYRLPDSTGTA